MKNTRAALYVRVSTREGQQHTENQARELRDFAARQGWQVTRLYLDEMSGASSARPGLLELFADAAARVFDVVLVWDLSRLTREGPAAALHYIERLKSAGVELWSYREEIFRTSGPFGNVLIAIVAWFAEQEREALSARVKAGLDRARAEGAQLGRPPAADQSQREYIWKAASTGLTVREIAENLNLSKTTVSRILVKLRASTAGACQAATQKGDHATP